VWGPEGETRRRWEDCIGIGPQEVDWDALTVLVWLRIVQEMGFFACGNDISGSINCR